MTCTGEPSARKQIVVVGLMLPQKVSPYEVTASNKIKCLNYNEAYKISFKRFRGLVPILFHIPFAKASLHHYHPVYAR
jgi:hypothetical protein